MCYSSLLGGNEYNYFTAVEGGEEPDCSHMHVSGRRGLHVGEFVWNVSVNAFSRCTCTRLRPPARTCGVEICIICNLGPHSADTAVECLMPFTRAGATAVVPRSKSPTALSLPRSGTAQALDIYVLYDAYYVAVSRMYGEYTLISYILRMYRVRTKYCNTSYVLYHVSWAGVPRPLKHNQASTRGITAVLLLDV